MSYSLVNIHIAADKHMNRPSMVCIKKWSNEDKCGDPPKLQVPFQVIIYLRGQVNISLLSGKVIISKTSEVIISHFSGTVNISFSSQFNVYFSNQGKISFSGEVMSSTLYSFIIFGPLTEEVFLIDND